MWISLGKVLIVCAEEALATLLRYNLDADGYDPSSARTSEELLEAIENFNFDAVVVDQDGPFVSIPALAKTIRQKSDVPIFALVRDKYESFIVRCYLNGVTQCFEKPFSVPIFLASVSNHLKKFNRVLEFQDISCDTDQMEFRCRGEILNLTHIERNILFNMLKHPNRIFSRAALQQLIWRSDEDRIENTIEKHISNLRRKLDDYSDARYIVTVRGIGYRFVSQ